MLLSLASYIARASATISVIALLVVASWGLAGFLFGIAAGAFKLAYGLFA